MILDPLTLALVLLAATVLVVTLARRLGLPAILGYLAVGLLLGPYVFGFIQESDTTRLLAELGIVFLLFTLGLEFSWPRMVAMRQEVFGLGTAQVLFTTVTVAGLAWAAGVAPLPAIVIGGALATSSTAIIVQQLTEQGELNRTHGRIAFSVVLFQDLAFVPFLVLATALASREMDFSLGEIGLAVGGGVLALAAVLIIGRYGLRPLLYQISHSRLREIFTLAVLLIALAAAWVSHAAGLSMATGAFLAGMMLAESEYRAQVEAVIRPFRDILLGLFFITVGMQLDAAVFLRQWPLVIALTIALIVVKAAIVFGVVRLNGQPAFKSLRTGIVLSVGGEFGVALLTILLKGKALDPGIGQPLLVAIVLSMIVGPLILRHNRSIVRRLLGESGPARESPIERDALATAEVARREHVILCGYGRVGQNVARVLEQQGFEFIAVDLDPSRIRLARSTGEPVVFGDSADEEVLRLVGVDTASAIVITFANPTTSIEIVKSIRRLRRDVPVLVRTQDDTRLTELIEAGATDVVPETLEASLTLVSHTLMQLDLPASRVLKTVSDIRTNRYATLRNFFRREGAPAIAPEHALREELRSVVIPPGAWAVGKSIDEVRARGAEVKFTGLRRDGIFGREPAPSTQIHAGDLVVIFGTPEALEHAETVLLAG